MGRQTESKISNKSLSNSQILINKNFEFSLAVTYGRSLIWQTDQDQEYIEILATL